VPLERLQKSFFGAILPYSSAKGAWLDAMVTLIQAWKHKHDPIDVPTPVEAIKFRGAKRPECGRHATLYWPEESRV